MQQDAIVLCKIYRKATSMKVLEQRASMCESSSSSMPITVQTKMEHEEETAEMAVAVPPKMELSELQLPMNMGWTQDSSVWPQLNSPWLQCFTPLTISNLLNC